MRKLFLLAMVFMLGFALPVFASGYVAGDGVYIGAASGYTMTENPILGVEQLGTAMETLLAVGIGLIVFTTLRLMAAGPAPNVPDRYDKARSFGLLDGLRRTFDKATKSRLLK